MPNFFPKVKGKSLAGKDLRLPGDLEGDVNLVLIAFQREQQPMVNTWLPTADLLEKINPRLRYYELPAISRMNPVSRWFINTGMRSGVKDPKSRERTITLFLDKKPFREALGIETEDTISILLLDRQGKVLWDSEGHCSVDSAEELSDFIQSYFRA